MRDASVKLALSKGIITKEVRRGDIIEKTIIDLIEALAALIDQLIYCYIIRKMK
jgi:hypothetical protein